MQTLQQLASLVGPFRFLREPGVWFWIVFCAGCGMRAFLVIATEGTLDVEVWDAHAQDVHERGLSSVYRRGTYDLNHPPFISMVLAWTWALGRQADVAFATLLRAPFALLDVATLWLLLRALLDSPFRWAAGALYWLHPLALIFSSYHGNTDGAIGFFTLAGVLLVVRGRAATAGAVLGLALWIKLPAALAAPALCLALPAWRGRVHYALAAVAVALLGHLPGLLDDARALIDAVWLYSGYVIQTESGERIWGIQNLMPTVERFPISWRSTLFRVALFYESSISTISMALIVLLAWHRRERRSVPELAWTITAGVAILFGFTNRFAFQYIAWTLPLWPLCGWRFALAASSVTTTYVYGLYAWLCSSPWLLGRWDFVGKPDWPIALVLLRDLATIFFLFAGIVVIARALAEWTERAPRSDPD